MRGPTPSVSASAPGPFARCVVMRYGELEWYAFGLGVGLRNLMANGGSLGWKRTLGKILQPIPFYTRFPEYHFFREAIRRVVSNSAAGRCEILDVGSPKLLGLYLSTAFPVRSHLTDLSEREIQECTILWSALHRGAKGEAVIERQDARALPYDEGMFDVVYAMSSLEHVEGDAGDSRAMEELWRVLKPSGTLAVSVPFGDRFVEQTRRGFTYDTARIDRGATYFFQRIYDKGAFEGRLLMSLKPRPTTIRLTTVYRSGVLGLASAFHALRRMLGENVSGALGFLNPVVSFFLNRHGQGLAQGFPVAYGPVYSFSDIYGDAILVCEKPALHDGSRD